MKIKSFVFIVLLPTILFVFLFFFAKNRYQLDIFDSTKIEKKLQTDGKTNPKDSIHTIFNFPFINHKGDTIILNQLEDKIFIVNFFFSRCSTDCLQANTQLMRVQELIKKWGDTMILSYSIEPNYDKIDILNIYAENYQTDPKVWLFLTAEDESAYQKVLYSYLSSIDKDMDLHNNTYILIDEQHRIRGYYDATELEEVDRLIMELQILHTYNN